MYLTCKPISSNTNYSGTEIGARSKYTFDIAFTLFSLNLFKLNYVIVPRVLIVNFKVDAAFFK